MKWIIEKLNIKLHNRNDFCSTVEILNVYLKTRANQEQEKNLNITYVATTPGEMLKPIIGYYTLSSTSLKRMEMPSFIQKGVPQSYDIPAILIGRLAVDQRYEKQGIGKFLLRNAFSRTIDLATLAGVKCISVVAKNEEAVMFYQKFGFTKLADVNQLILPIETLLKAKEQSSTENSTILSTL